MEKVILKILQKKSGVSASNANTAKVSKLKELLGLEALKVLVPLFIRTRTGRGILRV
jgi:hypothetical protein